MILEMILKPLMVIIACPTSWAHCFEVLPDEDNNYQLVKDAAESKVFNGYDAPEGLAPYVVRLGEGCGGSILNEHFILSAAHCNRGDVTTIIYGAIDLEDPEALIATSERFINHPKFIAGKTDSSKAIKHIQNDIAVLKVKGSLDLSGKAKAIPLTNVKPSHGTPVLLVGWGRTSVESGQAVKLQAANMSIAGCDWFSDQWIDFVCTNQRESAGRGDSGGPLAASGELVGVVSFGISQEGKSAYSDVSSYKNWIDKTMNENSS